MVLGAQGEARRRMGKSGVVVRVAGAQFLLTRSHGKALTDTSTWLRLPLHRGYT